MADTTFTLTGDLEPLVGSPKPRTAYIQFSTKVVDTGSDKNWQMATAVTVSGPFSWQLPAWNSVVLPYSSSQPLFGIKVTIGTHVWEFAPKAAGQTLDLSDVTNPFAAPYVPVEGPRGPQGLPGLPGVNAVPAAEAVAAYVSTPGSPAQVALSAAIAEQSKGFEKDRRRWFDIRDYGAKCDAVVLTDAAMTSGSATLTTARMFTSADVGKTVAVMGAGPFVANANDGVLITTIASVASAFGIATLAANAVTTCSGVRAVYGTPDDAAWAAARDAAIAAGGGTVYIPAGRTVVTTRHLLTSGISYAGEYGQSWVQPIINGNGTNDAGSTWMSAFNYGPGNPLADANFVNFCVQAEAMIIGSGAYTPIVKPLGIHHIRRSTVHGLIVRNTPCTALPFDHSVEACWITNNTIYNAGRLSPASGPGGSYIGMGTQGTGAGEPTVVAFNTLIGPGNATANAPGQNGIFVEAQTGATAANANPGYRIFGNYIEGVNQAIADYGSRGTIISQNVIRGCRVGIIVGAGSLASAHLGIDTTISENTILDGTGTGSTDGTGIMVYNLPGSAQTANSANVRTRVLNNLVQNMKSRGMLVVTGGTQGLTLDGVIIRGNRVRSAGLSGLLLQQANGATSIDNLTVEDNQFELCGTTNTSGDRAGITVKNNLKRPTFRRNQTFQSARGLEVSAGVTVGLNRSGGRMQGNDWGTQVIAGTIDPWVRISDNDDQLGKFVDSLAGSGALVGSLVGSTGKAWAALSGQAAGTSALTRSGTGLLTSTNTDSTHAVFAAFDAASPTQAVAATAVNTPAGAGYGIVFRAVDASNYWRLAIGTGSWVLSKIVGGTTTTVATYSVAAPGDRIGVTCSGDDIYPVINGVEQTKVTDTANNTATLVGVFISSASAGGVRLANFAADGK